MQRKITHVPSYACVRLTNSEFVEIQQIGPDFAINPANYVSLAVRKLKQRCLFLECLPGVHFLSSAGHRMSGSQVLCPVRISAKIITSHWIPQFQFTRNNPT
jgi:hypothetical protein